MDKRFWDLFYRNAWIGMASGKDLQEARQMTKRSLPKIHQDIKYAEWFGRFDPRNCKTSGGNVPDPQ